VLIHSFTAELSFILGTEILNEKSCDEQRGGDIQIPIHVYQCFRAESVDFPLCRPTLVADRYATAKELAGVPAQQPEQVAA